MPRPNAARAGLRAISCVAIVALALLANGCARLGPPFGPPTESPFGQAPPPATPPPHFLPTLAHNPELANHPDLILFMTALAEHGVMPLSFDTSQNDLLRPAPGLGYRLAQGHLHVHVYPAAADAHQRAPQVRVELAQSIADWIGTPHLFECGRLLAMYFGDDRDELAAVDQACVASQSTPTASMTATALTPRAPSATVTPSPAASGVPTLSLVTPAPTPESLQRFVSPDGQWVAQLSFTQVTSPTSEFVDNTHTLLTLTRVDGTTEWVIVDEYWWGLGGSVPQAVGWSHDGRYFWHYWVHLVDGCGTFFDTGRLLQADVTNGRVSPLDVGDAAAFSPSNAWVAFIDYSAEVLLVVRAVTTGDELRWPLNAGQVEGRSLRAGAITWSPDERSLVLTVAAGSLCDVQRPLFALVRYDIVTEDTTSAPVQLAERPLFEAEQNFSVAIEWPARDKILIQDWNRLSWWIDADTGAVTTAPLP